MIEEIDRSDRKRRAKVFGSTRRLCEMPGRSIGLCVAESFGCAIAAATMVLALENAAIADPLAFVEPSHNQSTIFDRVFRDQGRGPDTTKGIGGPANPVTGHRGQVVSYSTGEAAGTIVIDTPNTYLYFIVGGGKAVRYGIGVGREGFTWSGVEAITRKAEWPDWSPPAEMLARQPTRRPRHVPRWHSLSNSRHQSTRHDWQACLKRLHPHAERRCDRSL
jgi:hypothetical protein